MLPQISKPLDVKLFRYFQAMQPEERIHLINVIEKWLRCGGRIIWEEGDEEDRMGRDGE